ncbi:hypothetical protein DKK70_14305 [Gilliamella apicola]|uniref:Uncharacterized protein n=2 Tax=Gilliamella apicola TaxID=1196095 RepID=A0A2V4DTI2_9GAMM|nr:hypothetical protein DKK70_14305 [Gilliamella apicola]
MTKLGNFSKIYSMLFTFARPTIILPFYKQPYLFLMTVFIIASMSPIFEYFIRMAVESDVSHHIIGILLF